MKTLVLNVDRDDDFGRKAKVISPIIGFEKNLAAANKLGQADPEDSDLNAIFSAISTYNQLKKEGKDVEITTICGNINVGIKSDEILAKQLEEVILKTKADQVILISDGAEDEYILPIIQTRIKVTSISRVTVKQSKELEDTYYRIIKLLDDEKVQKQFILPISLVLIVWALFVLLDMASSGFGAILLTLGGYMLIRAFRWEKMIANLWQEIKSGFLTGKLSIYTSILAIVILIANIILTYNQVNLTDFSPNVEFLPILYFVQNIIWGIVAAGLLFVFGRAVDIFVRDKKTPLFAYIAPFSLIAFGFLIYAVFGALYSSLINGPENFTWSPFQSLSFIFYIISGALLIFLGLVIHHFMKDIRLSKEKEIEIEENTRKIAEKN